MDTTGDTPTIAVASAATSSGVVIAAISLSLALTGFSQVPSLPLGITGPTGPVSVAIGPQGGTATPDLSDEGTIGPVGLLGSSGITGPIGPQGLDGSSGISGIAGADGTIGPMGPNGATGAMGARGLTGATGLAGIPGLEGLAGVSGSIGPQGPKGETGLTGETGPQGPVGPKGDTGAQGPKGDTGTAGVAVRYEVEFSGEGLDYGGTPATGSYIRNGDLVSFRIYVDLSEVRDFGKGTYSLTLPYAPIQEYVFRDGAIHDRVNGNHYQMYADATPDTRVISLIYHSGRVDLPMDSNSPLKLENKDFFYISGTYEIAQ